MIRIADLDHMVAIVPPRRRHVPPRHRQRNDDGYRKIHRSRRGVGGGAGNRDCARHNAGSGVGRAGRFRHEFVVSCVVDGRGDLRNPGGVGLVAFDRVRIDREVDRIADRPGHITIGVVSSRDTVSRAGCSGELRRRPHRLQDNI